MSERVWLNRRMFLKGAGATALAGAATSGASLLNPMASMAAPVQDGSGGFDFDTPYDRVGTDCAKWDTIMERHGAENIQVAMGVADMDFKCAPVITEALAERVKHENWGYLKMPEDFFPAIVDWNKSRHGLEINPDLMALSDGVHPALIAALKAFARPGSKVLLTTSTYSGFYTDLRESHTLAEESPLIIDNGVHRLDFDDLESRISQETDALILCNPQNPTGNCWSAEDLMRLGQLCLERRVVVLADEIHCDFVTKGQKYTPFASLPDKDVVNNSVTFQSGSKTFSLAAMKVAWFHSPNPDYFQKVQDQHLAQTNTLGVVAHHAALRAGRNGSTSCSRISTATTTMSSSTSATASRRSSTPRRRAPTSPGWTCRRSPRRSARRTRPLRPAKPRRSRSRRRTSSSAGWSRTPACTRTRGRTTVRAARVGFA